MGFKSRENDKDLTLKLNKKNSDKKKSDKENDEDKYHDLYLDLTDEDLDIGTGD